MRQEILLGRANRTDILMPLLLVRDPSTKDTHPHQLPQLDKVEAEQVAQDNLAPSKWKTQVGVDPALGDPSSRSRPVCQLGQVPRG